MTKAAIGAVLWDMDGTLIDSEPTWIEAQARMIADVGGTWTHEDGLSLVGADMQATADAMRAAGVRLSEGDIIGKLTEEVILAFGQGVVWRPGALELVTALNDAGVLQAIVTTSPRSITTVVASALPEGAIRLYVTGEDVTCGKPHPEPYLLAAHLLGVKIRACVAIEDSPTGLAAAIASGAAVIGVPNDAVLIDDGRWKRFDSLVAVTVEDLSAIADAHLAG